MTVQHLVKVQGKKTQGALTQMPQGRRSGFAEAPPGIEKMKTAAKLVQPVAYATDNLQRDSAGLQDAGTAGVCDMEMESNK